jgi:hypothetical protein
MKIFALAAITLMGAGLISDPAAAASFGTVTLRAGETQTVDIGSTGRNMRVCNDFFSSGPIIVTIGGNASHNLSPGLCAKDIGDRMMIQSLAGGLATVDFRSLGDNPGRRMFDD